MYYFGEIILGFIEDITHRLSSNRKGGLMSHCIEIGSEFELSNNIKEGNENNFFDDWDLTYSGRTSLHLVLDEICSQEVKRRAWLPSYCCASMVQPFIEKKLPVEFYSVDLNSEGKISRESFSPEGNDIVLSMSYFGFSDKNNNELIESCIKNRVTVIEDCTHSLLLKNNNFIADYRIASLRKWFPLASGGGIKKREGAIIWNSIEPDSRLVGIRIDAMKEKAEYLYLQQDEIKKKNYLAKYRQFNESLALNYQNRKIDNWSSSVLLRQDIEHIIEKRRENASILINGIKKFDKIKPLFYELGEDDCPLFVPILVKDRERLQQLLMKNKIYCPVHWPRPCSKAKTNLYETELSLICDQRYSPIDMVKILEIIGQFEKEC